MTKGRLTTVLVSCLAVCLCGGPHSLAQAVQPSSEEVMSPWDFPAPLAGSDRNRDRVLDGQELTADRRLPGLDLDGDGRVSV